MQAETVDRQSETSDDGSFSTGKTPVKARRDWRSALVRTFGIRASMIHHDTLVLDRWLWVAERLPRTDGSKMLADVGCGTGAFTIAAALRGYRSIGLSWDERNQRVAAERAAMCGATGATFDILDVRDLDTREDFAGLFDVVMCTECIEHIRDDGKLMRDLAVCLKPGGRLLLTTPYEHYRAITRSDEGPFLIDRTDGWHVRRGYTEVRLKKLCDSAGLSVERFSYCSGILSQKITFVLRALSKVHPLLGWAAILPLRPLPPLFDAWITKLVRWPCYSICLEARRLPPAAPAK
jgi:SAM-dependent methyltransferase